MLKLLEFIPVVGTFVVKPALNVVGVTVDGVELVVTAARFLAGI